MHGEHNDVAIITTSFKDSKRTKHRELALSVRTGSRLNATQADDIFDVVSAAIERELRVGPWPGPSDQVPEGRYRVWANLDKDAGRKVVRPVVERAVTEWEMR